MSGFTESVVEDAALAWLESLGYAVLHGPDIAVGMLGAERSDPNYRDVVLDGRLREALARLNPGLPTEALEDAYRKLTRTDAPSLLERNRAVHRMLVDGVTVEYRRKDGSIAGAQARVVDFAAPDKNDWLAINQFTVADGQHTRRPDVVVFVNGLPLAVIELKNPADENATIWSAYQQLQTYQAQIPSLFATNATLIVSDGVQARIGALAAGREWFKPWRTITGRGDAAPTLAELEVVLGGVFERRRFVDLLRYFMVFEDQGGGKSLTMAFYAGRVILHPEMQNPTIVVLTNRNDLDDQLFGTFARCKELLRQPTLIKIARELVDIVKKNVTIDWTVRENVRAQLRVIVKRILRKYGYPPDKQEQATQTVLEQAEVLSQEWAIA